MIIDETYFRYNLGIPSNKLSQDELRFYITRVEPVILKKMLGDYLYADFVANQTDERWQKLLNGHTYTVDDYTVIWGGLKNSLKISLLAYFTYAEILKDNDTYFSEAGAVQGRSDKGDYVSVNSKMCIAQSEGVKLYGSPLNHVSQATAFNFLKYGGYDFENWVFTVIEPINYFGL